MVRIARVGVVAVGAWLLLSAPAAAQTLPTAIAGVVRDTSGAVMPGVTVEAASDALIEKVSTVVATKRPIQDRRSPGGTYTVTFSLTGLQHHQARGRAAANFTANVDAEMRVGQLEETMTVSGQRRSSTSRPPRNTKVVSGELLYALPLTKEMGGLAKVTVGARFLPRPRTSAATSIR